MSGEIVVSETPNWLQSLEEKREKRLKARLGHEAGAGSPCLKCGDKCPGLDLHFWRKACKICRCPKEEHDVPDDDIYGWAQFQLLGSKPNKIKTKIVLPGKKDEVELEWTPKGQKETIDKYLKTLSPEALPVKGSKAAQERKQLLQKQIPIHDIDPSLCHELNEEEVKKMEEYIAHVKKSSVGVGQIVNLSSIIKANLHNISIQEVHKISSQYAKGIPFSEIVKLQSNLAKNLEKMTIDDSRHPKTKPPLPNMTPNKSGTSVGEQDVQNPLVASKFKDITHPWYTGSDSNKNPVHPQYAQDIRSGQPGGKLLNNQTPEYAFDEKLLQGTNFDPTKTPSQFKGYRTPGYGPIQHGGPLFRGQHKKNDDSSKEDILDDLRKPAEQYGFENPYFNQDIPSKDSKEQNRNLLKLPTYSPSNTHVQTETQNLKTPKSVKDLMYSTYDPSKGPVPEDNENPFKNKFNDSKSLDYDPTVTLNTFKHGPGDIRYEDVHLLNQSDPIQPFINKHDLKTRGLSPRNVYYNPEHMQYNPNSPQKFSEPEEYSTGEDIFGHEQGHSNFDLDPQKHLGPGYFDPNNLQMFSDPAYEYSNCDPKKKSAPGYIDPKTGEYISGDNIRRQNWQKLPNSEYIDPKTGAFITGRDQRHSDYDASTPQQLSGAAYIDPKTGEYIPGDNTRLQIPQKLSDSEYIDPKTGSVQKQINYDSSNPQKFSGAGYIDPKTGEYISGNVQRHSDYPQQFSGDRYINPKEVEHIPGSPYGSHYLDPRGRNTPRKPLSQLQPGRIDIPEDYLEPHMVKIGSIQDINPEIRAAMTGRNPDSDSESYNEEEYSPESIRELLNNIKLPDCHYCKKPFEENEYAVTVDRANVLFHAPCFKCAGCNQSLADNIYFYHKETDNVYCGRDYAKIKGYPRCSACDELIFTKEYCLAENSTFHLKHFCCFQCDTPLAGQDYTLEEDNKPYCLPCYESSKAAHCGTCEKVIKPEEVGCQLNGVHFHAEDRCFRCIVCAAPLMGKKLLLRRDKLYCSHDCFNGSVGK